MKLVAKKNLYEAKKLYLTAFPKEERLPWWVLRLMTLPEDVEITSYYDGPDFVGFTHSTTTEDTLFIMFFAINEHLRGKGYGSAILDYLKNRHSGKAINLNVEPLNEHAENADQRVMRMRFYKKNGFFDTGYNIDEVGGTFRVLSTKPELDQTAYLQVFRKLSLGFWKPYIAPVE